METEEKKIKKSYFIDSDTRLYFAFFLIIAGAICFVGFGLYFLYEYNDYLFYSALGLLALILGIRLITLD